MHRSTGVVAAVSAASVAAVVDCGLPPATARAMRSSSRQARGTPSRLNRCSARRSLDEGGRAALCARGYLFGITDRATFSADSAPLNCDWKARPLLHLRYGGEVTKARLADLRQWRSRGRPTWTGCTKWRATGEFRESISAPMLIRVCSPSIAAITMYHKPLMIHEINRCSSGCISRICSRCR